MAHTPTFGANYWVLTNGDIEFPICPSCQRAIKEGHTNCTCDDNHPDPCNMPNYNTLRAQRDELLAAAKAVMNFASQLDSPDLLQGVCCPLCGATDGLYVLPEEHKADSVCSLIISAIDSVEKAQ